MDIIFLISRRLLAKNIFWNLLGQIVPMLVAIVSIPLIIKGLGFERFGLLTIVWVLIGYFSIFDLGMGRALTHLVAEKLGKGQAKEIPQLAWSALLLMLLFGLIGTLVMIFLSPWLIQNVLKIPESLQKETLDAFYLLAFSIPIVISTSGLRGILEAQQHFAFVNAIRIPMGIFTYLGPLLAIQYSQNLFIVIAVLLLIRLIAWIAHLLLCFYVMPSLRHGFTLQCKGIYPLLNFGSWMTVSNIVSPAMTFLDRFFIGAIISVAAVAYYVTPYEVVTRFAIIPSAIVGVLFPVFSATFKKDRNMAVLLFGRAVKYTFIILFPIILVVVTLAHEGLELWLGTEFAINSTHVLQLLAVGVLFNSIAHIPFALLQGAGRPDLTAKIHLMELPFYLIAIWWLIGHYGIEGVAIAWMARTTLDAIILFIMAKRILLYKTKIFQHIEYILFMTVVILFIASMLETAIIKVVFILVTLVVFAIGTWFMILSPEERLLIQKSL